MLDTAKDARVLVLEDALRRLNEVVGNRKLKTHIDYSKLNELLKTAGSLLYEVKYSYLDSKSLADLEATSNLVEAISQLSDMIDSSVGSQSYSPSSQGEKLALAEVAYSVRIVTGFQHRLKEHGEDPGNAVDMLTVEISNISPVQGSENLTECRCSDGSRIWTIVTNLKELKPATKLPVAILPPADMMGVVSEAMFLGGTPLSETVELGPLENPPEAALDQARAQVMQITKRMS
jgi:predicted RNA-binding protein with EMAP domain